MRATRGNDDTQVGGHLARIGQSLLRLGYEDRRNGGPWGLPQGLAGAQGQTQPDVDDAFGDDGRQDGHTGKLRADVHK